LSEGVFDLPDLVQRTGELADFLSEFASTHNLNPEKMIAAGFSNGANMAASLLLSRPETLGGAILIRAMVPMDPTSPPNLIGKRVLLLAGDHDPLVPVPNAETLHAMFREYGAESTFELLRASHDFTQRDLTLAQEWLAAQP
jgi:predicted esterase